jgi:hypothetical protein
MKAALCLVALLAGCAAPQAREVCGTLPDGSGFCVTYGAGL